jgi:hypothetical protein
MSAPPARVGVLGSSPARFAGAIGLGAFLIFEVQFILAKRLLPWFGGVPAVWTTCLLFFQVALLLGYVYAHALARLAPRRQRDVHLALLAAALVLLATRAGSWPSPLTPGDGWKPDPAAAPLPHLLWLLSASVGLPYLVLASTGPLLQSWFARLFPERSPYRLFALSNLGSLLGLLSYPFAVEPWLSVAGQGWLWTAGFLVFAVGSVRSAMAFGRAAGPAPAVRAVPAAPLPFILRVLWFGLSAAMSTLLLAVTSQICEDVAVIPFLWVLPLGLYLLSFILCFEYERFHRREIWFGAVVVAAVGVVYALQHGTDIGIGAQIALYSAALLAYGMACHGELARLKPEAARLTSFYLIVAAGGAAGGLFAGVLAPRLFLGFWELHLALLGAPVLLVAALLIDPGSWLNVGTAGRLTVARIAVYVWLAVLAGILGADAANGLRGAAIVRRGFFGVLSVALENRGDPDEWRKLRHGRIAHGLQFTAPARRREPTTYYGPKSGAGLALRRHPRRLRGEPLRVGLVGLGVGTLVAYAGAGDVFRIYEIDPEVLRLSTGPDPTFTFVRDAPGEVATVLGDARLSLEREMPQSFDVVALDAFSSDAIPVHLLTREAAALYLRHLRGPDSVVAVHVSNKYLDLKPVVRALAGALGLRAALVDSRAEGAVWSSDWVLLVRDPSLLLDPEVDRAALPLAVGEPGLPLWTDDYSNLLRVLR